MSFVSIEWKCEPRSGICRIRSDVEVILLVSDEVHPAEVHGFVTAIETDVSFFGLAGVAWWPDNQPLDVGQNSFIFRIRICHGQRSILICVLSLDHGPQPSWTFQLYRWAFCASRRLGKASSWAEARTKSATCSSLKTLQKLFPFLNFAKLSAGLYSAKRQNLFFLFRAEEPQQDWRRNILISQKRERRKRRSVEQENYY